jgi:hypothetical protein
MLILAAFAAVMMPFEAAGQKEKERKYDFRNNEVDRFHEGMAAVGVKRSLLRLPLYGFTGEGKREVINSSEQGIMKVVESSW